MTRRFVCALSLLFLSFALWTPSRADDVQQKIFLKKPVTLIVGAAEAARNLKLIHTGSNLCPSPTEPCFFVQMDLTIKDKAGQRSTLPQVLSGPLIEKSEALNAVQALRRYTKYRGKLLFLPKTRWSFPTENKVKVFPHGALNGIDPQFQDRQFIHRFDIVEKHYSTGEGNFDESEKKLKPLTVNPSATLNDQTESFELKRLSIPAEVIVDLSKGPKDFHPVISTSIRFDDGSVQNLGSGGVAERRSVTDSKEETPEEEVEEISVEESRHGGPGGTGVGNRQRAGGPGGTGVGNIRDHRDIRDLKDFRHLTDALPLIKVSTTDVKTPWYLRGPIGKVIKFLRPREEFEYDQERMTEHLNELSLVCPNQLDKPFLPTPVQHRSTFSYKNGKGEDLTFKMICYKRSLFENYRDFVVSLHSKADDIVLNFLLKRSMELSSEPIQIHLEEKPKVIPIRNGDSREYHWFDGTTGSIHLAPKKIESSIHDNFLGRIRIAEFINEVAHVYTHRLLGGYPQLPYWHDHRPLKIERKNDNPINDLFSMRTSKFAALIESVCNLAEATFDSGYGNGMVADINTLHGFFESSSEKKRGSISTFSPKLRL